MTRSLLLALALSASASAQALEGLPFTSFEARAPWASLFEAAPSVPAAMERAVGGEVAEALADGAASFSRELGHGGDPLAGGGVGGPDAFLSAILGFIPGFGLGHLVAGSISGFLEWLIVDIVLGVVLFYILPVLLLPTFALIVPVHALSAGGRPFGRSSTKSALPVLTVVEAA